MELLRVISRRADEHKVLAVALAPEQLLGEGDSVYQLTALEAGMSDSDSPIESHLARPVRRGLHLQTLDQ